MTLHLHLPGSQARTAEHQQELREARRLLKERVRDNWEYPTLPAYRSCGRLKTEKNEKVEDRVAGFKFQPSAKLIPTTEDDAGESDEDEDEGEKDEEEEEEEEDEGKHGREMMHWESGAVEWRERVYSSMSDSEGNTKVGDDSDTDAGVSERFQFENADSVGAQLIDRRAVKKRKRAKALVEEMAWNDGLAHFTLRRDAWCSARPVAPPTTHTSEDEADNEEEEEPVADSTSTSGDGSSSRDSTSDTSSTTPASSPSSTPDLPSTAGKIRSTAPNSIPPVEVLIPVAPPLLPNHPIRRRITTSLYPEIYSKVIVQCRAPSVPINLQTLIKALVQGWKADGEWPPKSTANNANNTTAPEKSGRSSSIVGRKKNGRREPSGIRESVKAVVSALRLTGISEIGTTKAT